MGTRAALGVVDAVTPVGPHRWMPARSAPAVLLAGFLTVGGCGAGGADESSSPASPTSSSSPSSSPSGSSSSTGASPSTAPTTPAPKSSTPLKKPRTIYWQSLKPGMCVKVPDEDEVIDITVTDCRAEHDAEVIARTTVPGGRTWPGDAAVDTAATSACEKTFERYVGLPFDESRLDVSYFTTERVGWEDGDRRLICLVYDPEAETTAGTLKGSKL